MAVKDSRPIRFLDMQAKSTRDSRGGAPELDDSEMGVLEPMRSGLALQATAAGRILTNRGTCRGARGPPDRVANIGDPGSQRRPRAYARAISFAGNVTYPRPPLPRTAHRAPRTATPRSASCTSRQRRRQRFDTRRPLTWRKRGTPPWPP